MNNSITLTQEQKETYNRLFVEQIERLSKYVKEGDRTSRDIVSELNEIAQSIREVNNL